MPPPGLPPAKAWEVATPLQELWLVEPDARLNRSLSASEQRALEMLIQSGGRVSRAEPYWSEPGDGAWTLADHGETLRAELQGIVMREIQSGRILVYGYAVKNGVISEALEPVLASRTLFVGQAGSTKRIDPFDSGSMVVGERHWIELRGLHVSKHETANSPSEPSSSVSRKRRTKPNFKHQFLRALQEIMRDRPGFLHEGDRASQAIEVKRMAFGDIAANNPTWRGCSDETAKRWIGEVTRNGFPDVPEEHERGPA